MNNKEKEIANFMKSLDISREEAEQLWEDDHSDEILPEVAEMEKGAKEMARRYEQKEKKKATEHVRKVDEVKGSILSALKPTIEGFGKITFQLTETEMDFEVDGTVYTLKLTKHKKGWQRTAKK